MSNFWSWDNDEQASVFQTLGKRSSTSGSTGYEGGPYKKDPDPDPYKIITDMSKAKTDSRGRTYTIDEEAQLKKNKNQKAMNNAMSGVAGGLTGMAAAQALVGERADNPYDVDATKPSGLMSTSLSSQLSYEGLKAGNTSESNRVVTDVWQGMFAGGTQGFSSGGWIGMLTGGVSGAITGGVQGSEDRTKFRNKIRDEEALVKANIRQKEMEMASIGASAGAYQSNYKGISEVILDREKRRIADYYQNIRSESNMKDFNWS